MAYMYIKEKELRKLIKEELEEATDADFANFLITNMIQVVKDWQFELDYNKVKTLRNKLNNLLKEIENV